jgi:hypothetical protein
VSVSTVLYPRWPPLLKIEISSNGQNCSILSQKVPKFELYKHNDDLFNIYYGIFYELRIISAKFGWDWLSSFRGDFFLFHPPFFLICIIGQNRWPPLLKIEISSNNPNCSILSQKVPKFELYKHNDELFNIYYGIFYKIGNSSKFIKNSVIYVKKLIIMLIQFKFGHFLA